MEAEGRKTHQWQRNQRNTLSFLIREEGCHNRESAVALCPGLQTCQRAKQKLLWLTVMENKSAHSVNSAVSVVIYGCMFVRKEISPEKNLLVDYILAVSLAWVSYGCLLFMSVYACAYMFNILVPRGDLPFRDNNPVFHCRVR